MNSDSANLFFLLLMALPAVVLLFAFASNTAATKKKEIAPTQWRHPQPISIALPLDLVMLTVQAELSHHCFRAMKWQIVDDLPNQGSEGESEILLAATLAAAGDDVATVRIPGELDFDQDPAESFDLPFELLLKIKLQATGRKTRLEFEFVPLAGEAALLQDAARDIISELEQSLRMKLAVLLQIYGIVSRQSALASGIISGIGALPVAGFAGPANVAPLSFPEPFSFPGPQPSAAQLSAPVPPVPPVPPVSPVPSVPPMSPVPPVPAEPVVLAAPLVQGVPTTPGDSSKCPGCGQPINDIFSFCLYCGYTVKQ